MSISYLTGRSGSCMDGNIGCTCDDVYKYGVFSPDDYNFNGYAGVSEFTNFPLRQLFVTKYKSFPCEWDNGYFAKKDIMKYAEKNRNKIIVSHYTKNGKDINNCVIHIGGKECIYIYIYNRRTGFVKKDEAQNFYAVAMLFKEKTKKVDGIIKFFNSIILSEEKQEFGFLNILALEGNDFKLIKNNIKCPEIDFDINYNEDFLPIHKLILEKLSKEKSKGLFLFHGNPGTGKTTYIRYLINQIKKTIIFIPPNMANCLSEPALVKFLIENPNSILVIEDAENVLSKRSSGSSQAIANVLNLTDGLLSDCANIQIIATFNTDQSNIDEALLRKGRLIAKYEFTKLSEDRCLKLAKKLGVKIQNSNTLADIYNANEISFTKEKKRIGLV